MRAATRTYADYSGVWSRCWIYWSEPRALSQSWECPRDPRMNDEGDRVDAVRDPRMAFPGACEKS